MKTENMTFSETLEAMKQCAKFDKDIVFTNKPVKK